MKKISLLITVFFMCFLVACGKNGENKDLKKYVVPGNIMFSPDDDKEMRKKIVSDMKNQESFEEIYLNDNGDVVMVMTKEQCDDSLANSGILIKEMMDFYTEGKVGYSINAERTMIELNVKSKDDMTDEYYQGIIDNVLDTLFLCQILNDVEVNDAKVEVKINYMDTEEVEVFTYTVKDMP